MKVDRLRQVHARLHEFYHNGPATPEAWVAQLEELSAAIDELEARPQTHVNTSILGVHPHWKQWEENLGYPENPFVRVDGLTVFREPGKNHYCAKVPAGTGGTYLTDKRGRKRHWQHVVTAMSYIDRDFPCPDKETWADKDRGQPNAGSSGTDT